MCDFSDKNLSLERLLRYCSDVTSSCHECGWTDFIRKYERFIVKVVTDRCRDFRVEKFGLDVNTTADQIVGDVYNRLYVNNCRALYNYVAVDNEKKFLSYLAIICVNATINFIKPYLKKRIVRLDEIQEPAHPSFLPQYFRWQYYEEVVEALRDSGGPKKNRERDIHIFVLRVWADFSNEMVAGQPYLKKITAHNVEVIVARLRKELHNNPNLDLG